MVWLFRFLFWIKGWKVNHDLPEGCRKCVMIAAPHTSNWDAVFLMASFHIIKIPLKFTIKKEWFRFPFGGMLRSLGGLAIDRTPKKEGEPRKSYVEAMTELFADRKELVIAVTPEGTRSKRETWKTGFYWVAKNAGVPVGLGYLDWKTKTSGIGKMIYPGDDFNKDMDEIMDFYKSKTAKFPENFAVGYERK